MSSFSLPTLGERAEPVELWTEVPLSLSAAIGQTSIAVVGILGFLVVGGLMAYLAILVFRPGTGERKEQSLAVKRFLLSDLGSYFMCLMVCDLAPIIGSLANIRWARLRTIHHESLCDFQGSMAQFGVFGSFMFNLIIAIHTFMLLTLRIKPPKWCRYVFLAVGWLVPIFGTIMGPVTNKASFSFFGPTSAGCWITFGASNYVQWYQAVVIVCLLVLFFQTCMYVTVWLSLSGSFEKFRNRAISGTTSSNGNSDSAPERSKEVISVARKMLWFPILNAALSLPIIVTVILSASGKIYSQAIYLVADALFTSLGIADVFLFYITRKGLLHKRRTNHIPSGIHMTVQRSVHHESFGVQTLEYDETRTPGEPMASHKGPSHSKRISRKSNNGGVRTSSDDGEDEVGLVFSVGPNPSVSVETIQSGPWVGREW